MNRDHELDKDAMNNVVSFPFGKAERVSHSAPISDLSDPIEELLNEFAEWEIEEEEWEPLFGEPSVDMSLIYPSPPSDQGDELSLLTQQIDLLEDVTKRMKFYLDEVELFTPHLRR
tara:strand:+ start:16736 stop:17083 length:348 start_codon:yes stop_codon:yes gene_type:complete